MSIIEMRNGKKRISVKWGDQRIAVPVCGWDTSYPTDLVLQILDAKGPARLCDEIMRDEDPCYIQRTLELSILGYVDRDALAGKTLLDFGCGCGASTMVLARLFPQTRITGIDMEADFIGVAKARAAHYGFANTTFNVVSDPKQVLEAGECFDFAVLSAVYEHLLPTERLNLIPLIWSSLETDGLLFINQTPYRWFPIENHTTGLPLINYLPDRLAYAIVRRFNQRVQTDESWERLLRRGIRGGTSREIMKIIRESCQERPILLEPCHRGCHDRIDLWYTISSHSRLRLLKQLMRALFKCLKYSTGLTLLPNLCLAIRKDGSAVRPGVISR